MNNCSLSSNINIQIQPEFFPKKWKIIDNRHRIDYSTVVMIVFVIIVFFALIPN